MQQIASKCTHIGRWETFAAAKEIW